MAVTLRATPRRGHFQHILIAAALAAAVVAVMPIAFAIFGDFGPVGGPVTAFASAPPGDYAVVARTEGDIDVIAVAAVNDPLNATEVARVRHLPGFSTKGSVSPDGKRVAIVAPDSGTSSQPRASVLLIEMETGMQTQLARDVDPQAPPLWTRDGSAVVVARPLGSASARSVVRFVRVRVDGGGEHVMSEHAGVLGAYGIGFDPRGRFLAVVIDGRGSTLVRDGADVLLLTTQISRDWRLSPDGTQLAFIESNLDGGLHYQARLQALDGSGPGASAQGLGDGTQQLGVAWRPGSGGPTFGSEGALATPASGQALTAASALSDGVTGGGGFDVPLGYSGDGTALAVNHWTGTGFAQAGKVSLQVVTDGGRTELAGFGTFFGWAAR